MTEDRRTPSEPPPPEPGPASHDPHAHRAAAAQCRAAGDELAALAHLVAAETLEASAPRATEALLQVATGYFMLGDHARAQHWYELVLGLDPGVAAAHQNLAAIHAQAGRDALARLARERAYAIQRVFVEPVRDPARQLLILCAGHTGGNIPLDTLLSASRATRIKYVIDHAGEDEDRRLPPFDLVFNAVGEPDVAQALGSRIERFAEHCGRAVLNAPLAVERTQRHRLPDLLRDLAGVVVADCVRWEAPSSEPGALRALLSRRGLRAPLLLRPAATHGGLGLERCDSLEALEARVQAASGVHYVTQFVDTRGPDGCYRKYRMVFVDREPMAYHLAISAAWMVHYFSADMLASPWKVEEERRFLQDPRAALGAPALAALHAIGRRLDLDYAGIDFTVLPDGRVFVFEANATMLVHRERENGALAHKNAWVQRIVQAFEALQARRMPT